MGQKTIRNITKVFRSTQDRLFGRVSTGTGRGEELTAAQVRSLLSVLTTAEIAAAYQPLDSDLTTIAGLTATTDSFLQSKSSAWAARTISQVKTDLGLTGTNSGDQTITLTGNVTGSGTGSFATTIGAGVVTVAMMSATGTPSATTFLRGDNTWSTPGGSGTVTATGGSLTANSVVLGAGTTDTKVVAGIITDGISILTLGVSSTTAGKIVLFGSTSGSLTLQSAAAASSTITFPNGGTLVTTASTQTLTNKTLTAPIMTAPVLGTVASGDLSACTGTASGLTAGNVTTNANLTGHVTSTGNAAVLGSFTKAQLNTAVSDGDVVYLDSVDAITGVKTMSGLNVILMSSSGLTIRNPANTFKYTITAAAILADRTLTLPLTAGTIALTSDITGTNSGTNTGDQTSIVGITGTKSQFNTAVTDGDIVYLDSIDTVTGVKTMTGLNAVLHSSSGLTIRNPADTFKYTFTAAAILADRTLTLPLTAGTLALTSDITGTNSGTNTGDQTITLTGNVTGSGTGSFATTIAAGVVTNAMLAGSIAASKLVGTDIATVGTVTAGTWSSLVVVSTTIRLSSEVTGTPSGTTQTIDLTAGNHQTLALTSATGTVTATLTVPASSSAGTIIVKQHASAAKSVTWAVSSGTIQFFGAARCTSADAVSSVRCVAWRWDGSIMWLGVTELGQNQ